MSWSLARFCRAEEGSVTLDWLLMSAFAGCIGAIAAVEVARGCLLLAAQTADLSGQLGEEARLAVPLASEPGPCAGWIETVAVGEGDGPLARAGVDVTGQDACDAPAPHLALAFD